LGCGLQVSTVVRQQILPSLVWLDVAREAAARRGAMNYLPMLSPPATPLLAGHVYCIQAFSLFYRELFLFRCISVNSGKSLLLNHIHLSLVTPHPT